MRDNFGNIIPAPAAAAGRVSFGELVKELEARLPNTNTSQLDAIASLQKALAVHREALERTRIAPLDEPVRKRTKAAFALRLPDDVWKRVLGQLSFRCQLCKGSRVCTAWKAEVDSLEILASDPLSLSVLKRCSDLHASRCLFGNSGYLFGGGEINDRDALFGVLVLIRRGERSLRAKAALALRDWEQSIRKEEALPIDDHGAKIVEDFVTIGAEMLRSGENDLEVTGLQILVSLCGRLRDNAIDFALTVDTEERLFDIAVVEMLSRPPSEDDAQTRWRATGVRGLALELADRLVTLSTLPNVRAVKLIGPLVEVAKSTNGEKDALATLVLLLYKQGNNSSVLDEFVRQGLPLLLDENLASHKLDRDLVVYVLRLIAKRSRGNAGALVDQGAVRHLSIYVEQHETPADKRQIALEALAHMSAAMGGAEEIVNNTWLLATLSSLLSRRTNQATRDAGAQIAFHVANNGFQSEVERPLQAILEGFATSQKSNSPARKYAKKTLVRLTGQ